MPAALAVTDATTPIDVADRFLAAYLRGDKAAILALAAPDAIADYVPWGEAGRNPMTEAVEVWARYPAAFEGFAMPILARFKDRAARTALIATLNSGRQRRDVDGIANTGGEMACPHLFVITLAEDGRIRRVQVWCDQVTLYRQLGFPAGFVAERAL